MSKTLEYIGPHRPPWGDRAPSKTVSYYDAKIGINKQIHLQFIVKDKLCICENVPDDAAFKIINSSPAFIELAPGTKYSEKRIRGLKAKDNAEDNYKAEIAKLHNQLAEEQRKSALNAQRLALEAEASARENSSSSAPVDAKEVEKKELGVPNKK